MRAVSLPVFLFCAAAAAALVVQAQRDCGDLYSVPTFDAVQYQGGWFEIATSRVIYETVERDCYCTKANYTLSFEEAKPYVIVNNQCRRGSVSAPVETILGRADQNNAAAPGELTVTFGPVPPANPNYFVVEVGPADYSERNPDAYVLVGEPCRRGMWILSRSPTIDPAIRTRLLNTAVQYGFNPEAIGFRDTVQQGCW